MGLGAGSEWGIPGLRYENSNEVLYLGVTGEVKLV